MKQQNDKTKPKIGDYFKTVNLPIRLFLLSAAAFEDILRDTVMCPSGIATVLPLE